MQFLEIGKDITLAALSGIVGERNVDTVLHANRLDRTMKVGQMFDTMCENIKKNNKPVDWQRKTTILNKYASNSDVFEQAALASSNDWKILSALDTFPGMLRIPDPLSLPDSTRILGNGTPVSDLVYRNAMNMLKTPPHNIDSSIFGSYSARPNANTTYTSFNSSTSVFKDFRIPWGDVMLFDSLSNEAIDLPGYPEELDDERVANYETMPDLLYQYEPWQVFTSSGPRSATYTWELHRQMWNGDERDGKANELIRFCQACTYPEYKGSAVFSPTATLYIKGYPFISGVITSTNVKWSGPIGLDGFYLAFSLSLSFVEVSLQPLNHSVVRNMPLIG